jgi:hypothetical protein
LVRFEQRLPAIWKPGGKKEWARTASAITLEVVRADMAAPDGVALVL